MRVKVWDYYVRMCNDCAGIWFEQDNFADFVRGLAASENIPNDIVEFFKRREVLLTHKVKEKAKLCPR